MGLTELLVDLENLSDDEAEERGRELYAELYLTKGRVGELSLHKGGEVVFFEDRYEHAFRTSQNRIRNPYSKAKVARERIERIRWIKAILEGDVPNTECWLVPAQSGRRTRDRLYVVWENRYVIWLSSRDNGGWKFSSCYEATRQDIRRYTQQGTKIWTVPEKKKPRD